MGRSTFVAGAGAISAAVLTVLALVVSSPPGGSYSLKDMADYVAKSHRPEIFIALYLGLLSVVALLFMVSAMRELAGDEPRRRRAMELSWMAGIASAAALAIGWGVELVVPGSRALGGAKPIPAPVAYTFTQTGDVLIFGAGFFLLGCALVGFAIGVHSAAPAWWRWVAAVAGVAGIASAAFFPSFILALLLLALGIGLVAHKSTSEEAAPAPA